MSYTNGLDKPSDYFNTITYTGSGTSTAYTVGFPTDFIWIKKRDTEATDHYLFNKISGTEEALYSNLTNAEETNANSVTSFDANGFTSGNSGGTNQSGHGYVSWNWKAGGTASSNTDGSITSSVSANQDAGFSIVSYTGNGSAGATVGHGVGSALNMIIVKKRSSTGQWAVGHKAMDSTFDNFLFLDSNSAKGNADNVFNDTTPTSSLFSIGNAGDTNASGQTYIAYCFAEKQGYSKFGSYVGNGSTNGSYIHLGFSPAFVMVKRTDSTANWQILDNKRNTYNPWNTALFPDTTDPDTTDYSTDHLSNGFKLRVTTTSRNGSGASYIYMAFAENPFVTSTGVPATAR